MSMTPMQQPTPTTGMMNDDELAMMLELAGLAPQQTDINRQRAMVQQLRGMQPMNDGRMINNGRTFVASNPLEQLAPALAQGLASYREGQANTAENAYRQARGGVLNKYAQAINQRIASRNQPSLGFPSRPMPGEDMPETY